MMKKILAPLLMLLFLGSYSAFAKKEKEKKNEGLVWLTDVNKAAEISNKAHKPIFAFFTGSDWCGWCKKLQNEVFAKQEFIDWAKKNVILLELDFPRYKQQPGELMKQNNDLQQTFQVRGFPTCWMFYLTKGEEGKKSINPLGSLGYPAGAEAGKEQFKFLEEANDILKNKK
jgi:protein disulfide-isomerase